MEGVLFHDFDEAVLTEVPIPTSDVEEVLIEVSRVQLSVTECNLYRGKISHYDRVKRRLEDGSARILVHEFWGVIVEIVDRSTKPWEASGLDLEAVRRSDTLSGI